MFDLVIRRHHENKLWSPLPMPSYIAEYQDAILGLWGPSGNLVRGWVAGAWYKEGVTEKEWRDTCNSIAGSRKYWSIAYAGDDILVRFPYNEQDQELLKALFSNAKWDKERKAWRVNEEEKLNWIVVSL